MLAKETELASTDPILVHQVWIYCMQCGCFTGHHTAILNQVAALTGFSRGSFFGVRATDQVLPVELPTMPVPMQPLSDNMEAEDETIDEEEDLAAEQAGEDHEEHMVGAFYTVLGMSDDGGTLVSI